VLRIAIRRVIRWVLLALVAVVLAYEELQWRLSAVVALLGRLPLLRDLEALVRRLPPYGALALFALPSVLLFPLKLLALYWLAAGKKALGVGLIVAAKFTGTAIVARIFQLCKVQLLTIGWFRWVHDRLLALREAAYGIWRSMPVVRWWRMRKARISAWTHRWRAARHFWSR
jgi:hypothetical protein